MSQKNHQDIISFKIWQQSSVCLFVCFFLIPNLDTSDTDYLPAFLLKTG